MVVALPAEAELVVAVVEVGQSLEQDTPPVEAAARQERAVGALAEPAGLAEPAEPAGPSPSRLDEPVQEQ